MAQSALKTPYSTAQMLFGDNIQKWLNDYDQQRVASYALYEDLYWNAPETLKIVMRGANDQPIYLPSGRIICNTMNRYVMRGFRWAADPQLGSSTDQTNIKAEFDKLFRREKFASKFNTNKLYGIIRGDAIFYIKGNADKEEGSRISIEDTDPGSVFEITDEDDDAIVLGVEIIEQLASAKDKNKTYIRRQTWYKSNHPEHPEYNEAFPVSDGPIAYELRSLQVEGWDDPDPRKVKTYTEGETIPIETLEITHLPIYRWKNGTPEPGNPWGNSEMRGLETIITGVNQSVSDVDLGLSMAALGLYVTDAGKPVNDQNQTVPWGVGPAEVLEIASGKKFERIKGIDNIKPSQDHINMLQDQAGRVNGSGDVAQGRVDVSVAQSGIALAIRLGPILDEAGLRDTEIIGTLTQMFHDLKEWFSIYEGIDFGEAEMLPQKDDSKLPENKEARIKFLFDGLAMQPPLFSQDFVWSELRRLGWTELPAEGMAADIAAELEFYQSATDTYGTRLAAETDPATGDPAVDDTAVE